ncbi:hypothetical protein HU200_041717 [Digitaria exilis]|uniref:Fe2OG dioxygenase domain-containing protein n=1 Tax=Digitaria exilis TaxID=1010633 RepID=A0A835EGG9_9POAL|nr:hypothetical protein HU200_041717 [Digitaria exilis]
MSNDMNGTIPKIDFAGIDPAAASPGDGDSRWATVRAAVMDALIEHGGFEAVMDDLVAPELRAAMLATGGAAESLFSLPPTTKARYTNEKPHLGYVSSSIPGMPYETFSIMDPLSPDVVPALAGLMWPDTGGDSSFCETMHAYTERVAVLEAMVRRMVLESVGATAEHVEEQSKATSLRLRISRYPAPGGAAAEGRVGLPAHRDTSFLSVLTQNDVDGLEVECGRGSGGWARPALSPCSFLILAGDMLKVLTNGRVYSPLHRVVISGEKTRYSCILFSNPKDDAVVRAVDGAVDAQHPAVYKAFGYAEYIAFCFTREQYRNPNKVEAFAAVGGVDG